MSLVADKEPGGWFTQQKGRTTTGTSLLKPERWAYWHQRWSGKPGEDMLREALDIAEGDIELVIGRDMGWSVRPNAPSCEKFLPRIQKEVVWYKESGAIEYYEDWAPRQPGPVTEKDFVDRLKATLVVVKDPDDGKGRFCNNLTGKGLGINDGLIQRPFNLPKVSQFLVAAKRGDWFRRKDLTKAFYHFRLKEGGAGRKQTGFICPLFKKLARFTVPAFGLKPAQEYLFIIASAVTAIAAHVARRVAEELECAGEMGAAEEVMRAAESLDAYCDDFCSVAQAVAGAVLDLILTLEGEKLGIRWDPAKDVAGPKVTILGADMDSDALTMGIGAVKAAAYRDHLQIVLRQAKVGGTLARSTLEQLAGKLGFCTMLSRWCTSFMAVIWASLWPPGCGGAPPQSVIISQTLLDDLADFWQPVLADPGAPWLRRSQWTLVPIGDARVTEHHVSASDASGNYGIGGISEWDVFQRTYALTEQLLHITFKELLALADVVITEAERYANKRVIAECDNSGAAAYVNRGGGSKLPGRNTILRLALVCIFYNIDLRAVHRSGEHMRTIGTDGVSRARLAGATTLPGPTGSKGIFDVDANVGAAVTASLRGDGFRAPVKPTVELSHLRKLQIHTLDGIRVHRHPGPAPARAAGGATLGGRGWTHAHCWICQRGQAQGTPLQLLCRECGRAAHASCLKVQVTGRREWLCGRCVAAAPNEARPPGAPATMATGTGEGPDWNSILRLHLDRATAYMAQAHAAGTDATYASSRRRFIGVVQAIGRESNVIITEAHIFPAAPGHGVPKTFVMGFVAAAAFRFATGTIEGTLSSLRQWHVDKGRGKLPCPTDDFDVRQAMDGVRSAHAGTIFGVQKAALAIHPAVLLFLVFVGDDMIDRAMSRSDFRAAHGYARDLVWYTISFLACLRREEAAALRRSNLTPSAIGGAINVFIRKSKTDQHKTGFTLPVAGTTVSGISLIGRIIKLDDVLKAWGQDPGDTLFGNMNSPGTPLTSSQSIVDRLMTVYVPEMCTRGLRIPDSFRYSGHSFRRGGINAIRDAARAAGVGGEQLRSILMKFGRWVDPRSLEVYLAEDYIAMGELTVRI
uniref:PHD-type domain-containing protein n=1 Tax=Mantoniella antarctica TaxID=81844 RepID=A0A7S0XCH3_9CHLO|mmetsp:Transcript_35585/g.88936  ORF Transcript_35585/g.88936 Transcript_35585/m.88936 type:complete len:1087 (+) Transcript_35585:404-3664(+)